MLQAGVSRPGTQQSLTGRLPEIQHPLSRLGRPENLDVRGTSRCSTRSSLQFEPSTNVLRPATQNSQYGRPMANEVQYRSPRRSAASGVSGRSRASPKASGPMGYEAIPEGVEVTMGDPKRGPRMPVFGNRQEMGSRAESRQSRMSRPSTQLRLEIDEFEMILKEKMKNGYYEVKKRFKDNDPEQRGNVSRDAFFRILVTIINRPLNQSQFHRLSDRLGLADRNVVSFTDFHSRFREVPNEEFPNWIDPIQRQREQQQQGNMSAVQVHAHLKEKAKQRVRDIADLIPQCNPDGSGRVLKPEFRNVLNRLGFYMDDIEFDKLWSKYDPDGYGTINGEKMMSKLGVSIDEETRVPSSPEAPQPKSGLLKKEAERQRSLDIERWLKDKFREGFKSMKAKFESIDYKKTGMIAHAEFIRVLVDYGLALEKSHLAEFLARCSVQPTNKEVPYRDFLHRFQDRSEAGMSHNILTNPKHRYNRAESPDNKSTISALETQIMNMFQRDFLSLLGTFHKIDRLGTDRISQEEFRAAIESRFELEMADGQYRALVDRVPLDDEGNVKYADFMAQFDTRGKAKSLFSMNQENKKPLKPVGALPADPSPPPPICEEDEEESIDQKVDRLTVDHNKENYMMDIEPKRSAQELFKIIKDLLKRNYQGVEGAFYELDELNSRRLSQETMYHLMKRFDINPEISRGEVRNIWRTFITNSDKTLDFQQFTRHFGYSLKSAAFPNAKVQPPRKGDSDFMMRSRKLNCAADMLQDNLRSKIDYMWEDLRREFVAMDPYSTGHINADEFRDILSELCVHLSNYELDMLTKKFDIKGDGRVSFIEFLKPFALKKQLWKNGNNMLGLLQHTQAEIPMADIVEPPQKGLHGVTAKLRQRLSGDWKNLRRAFKKMDQSNSGYLSAPEFRSVLKLANVALDEEEVYQVLSQFDEDMAGKIPYNKFLNETFRPETRDSHSRLLRHSASM